MDIIDIEDDTIDAQILELVRHTLFLDVRY
jgi:hypothetical protein